jgi:hypothetical protein
LLQRWSRRNNAYKHSSAVAPIMGDGMNGIEQISSVTSSMSASAAGSMSSAGQRLSVQQTGSTSGDLPAIGIADEAAVKSIGNDFTKVLETYRAKSESVDTAVMRARGGDASGAPNQREMIKQLTDLYTYAVDTQLLVRTAGQLTSGVRQLVTGQ